MGRKIDLTKKTINNTAMMNKNKRPINHYQDYQEEPEELEDEDYEQEEEDYNEQEQINRNIKNEIIENQKQVAKDAIKTKAKAKILVILKNPIVIKVIVLIIILVILLLMLTYLISVIASIQDDYTSLLDQCYTVTVVNTGCDENGENCSNQYDGDISFEEYISGVLAAEIGTGFDLEYYKLSAIAVRTYTLSNMSTTCTVEGNSNFQKYIDVNDSPSSEIIKEAIEETKGEVILQDEELISAEYTPACIINTDNSYYYIRYGSRTLEEPKIQKIPKGWANNSSYGRLLQKLNSKTDQNNKDYYTKECPEGTNDYGITLVGALYLTQEQGYSYDSALKYYYGTNLEIKKTIIQTSELINGYANPTTTISCSSPFGNRIHPVSGESKFHSGIDIGIAGGSPVYSAKEGIVSTVVNNVSAINNCSYGYGNHIIINHQDGTTTLYAHLKYGSIPSAIKVGNKIEQGVEIGSVGSTGCSTGNHLHYEVRVNGSAVDPANYLDLSNATGTCRR